MRDQTTITDTHLASLSPLNQTPPDLVCLSHLRWDFVYQRPQHLLSRFAHGRRVFFVEEPVVTDGPEACLDVSRREGGLHVVVPHVPEELPSTCITLQSVRR